MSTGKGRTIFAVSPKSFANALGISKDSPAVLKSYAHFMSVLLDSRVDLSRVRDTVKDETEFVASEFNFDVNESNRDGLWVYTIAPSKTEVDKIGAIAAKLKIDRDFVNEWPEDRIDQIYQNIRSSSESNPIIYIIGNGSMILTRVDSRGSDNWEDDILPKAVDYFSHNTIVNPLELEDE